MKGSISRDYERERRALDLTVQTLDMSAPERAQFLARECGADDALRDQVLGLLAIADQDPSGDDMAGLYSPIDVAEPGLTPTRTPTAKPTPAPSKKD